MMDVNEDKLQKPIDLKDWKKAPSLQSILDDVSDAAESLDNHLETVKRWIDNLYVKGSAKPKKVKGKSNFVPKLIRKQFEWRCAALSAPFLSNPNLYQTAPRTHADVESARKNGLILNYQFNYLLDKERIINKIVRTNEAEGTVIIKVGWEEKKRVIEVEEEQFDYVPAVSEEEQQVAQAIIAQYESDPSVFGQKGNEHFLTALQMSLTSDTMYIPVSAGIETVEKEIVVKNQPTVEVCNIQDVTFDPSCKEDYTKAKFVEHRFESSIADLRELGIYENLDNVKVEDNTIKGIDHVSNDRGIPNQNFDFNDRERKRIMVHEYWGLRDIHGDGILTTYVVTYVGDTVIRMDDDVYPDGEFPFVVITHTPIKNSVYGEPDGELLEDNQKLSGALTRGILDTVGSVAAGQRGTAKGWLDAYNYKRYEEGLHFQFNPNMRMDQAFYETQMRDIPASALTLLEYQNNDAESFTGTKTYGNEGVSGNALGNSVGGINQAVSASALRDSDILIRLVSGIRKIGYKIIAMNKEFLSPVEEIRITDSQFETIELDELQGEVDIILFHSTTEEDQKKANQISFLLQTLGPNASWEERMPLLAKLADLQKMPDLAEYYRNYRPQPNPADELTLEKLKLEIENLRAENLEIRTKAMLNQASAKDKNSSANLKDLDLIETESGVKSERRKDEIRSQSEGNKELEILKHNLSTTNADKA